MSGLRFDLSVLLCLWSVTILCALSVCDEVLCCFHWE